MKETSVRIAELSSEEKRELLAGLLRKKAETKGIPLSFAQQRLWFLEQLEPGSTLYNIALALRLRGPLNQNALNRTLSEVVSRHEVLRTRFEVVAGQPRQIVSPPARVEVPLLNLAHLSHAEREAEVRRVAAAEGQQPFDLSAGPLLRVKLLRLGTEEHVLLFTMHHIISDGWSMGVLVREVSELYAAFSKNQPSPLEELPIQYADYALWQRERLQGEALEQELTYWREQLADAPQVLELPTDRPRPATQSFHGAAESFTLSRELTEQLKQLSRGQNVTLFMTLLAAFQTLLSRYSGQADVVVGTPIANRTRSETEGLIGFFVNTLVLRTRFNSAFSFVELLRQVREVTLGAYAHQELPFEKLLEELQPERNLSHTPLFQVMFALQNAPEEHVRLEGIELATIEGENETAKFELTLSMTEGVSGLAGTINYRTELFDASTVRRFIAHFERLLKSIVSNPEQQVVDLPILTEDDQRLVSEVNDTQRPFSSDLCVHQLFERQAERSPDATALVFAEESMTYAELNGRANQLAHHLRSLGVGPEILVGILLERSVEMVVAVLGVLKAGGAYVPLDPEYPRKRLSFMLADAEVSVLLTERRLLERAPQQSARVVLLDEDCRTFAGESEENPVNRTQALNTAYVIYTSGSTGTPKGVMLTHRGLCNLALNHTQNYYIGPNDRVLQVASLSFDASVAEIFMALLAGAALCLVRKESLLPGPDFIELLREQAITNVTLPPSALNVLPAAELPALRAVISAGEACSLEVVKRWAGEHHFINGYGPTESTVCATYGEHSVLDHKLSIGRPIPNVQVYILDQRLNIVPVGVPGELYIAGCGLARGYLKRPALTAERFIPHPFSTEPGARLYRTGDIARYLADGNVEFIGRMDEQVKVRGYRIEPGEIEAVLSRHEAIRETAVLLREVEPGEKRLVAYVVAANGRQFTNDELRGYLQAQLPAYMIPSAFVRLDALPLTANGKLNRGGLPAYEQRGAESEDNYVAPRTAAEELLASIWSKVLRVQRVGIHDNFFKLGGDSILSVQIVARANDAGLRLTPKLLFQHQTIAALAAAAVYTNELTAPAQQGPVSGAVPLTPIQHWFFEQRLENPHHFNQSLLLELSEAMDAAALEAAVNHLVTHHDALRLRFTQSESGWQQENLAVEPHQVFRRVDLSAVSGTELSSVIEAEAERAQQSLHLTQGSLLRVVLFDCGESQAARLLVVIHHLAVDGVSWRILLEDLQQAYEQTTRGEEVRLSAKTNSYQQWSERLEQYAKSTALEQERAYWSEVAEQRVEPLPVDYAAGGNSYDSAKSVTVSLSREQTKSLLQEVPAVYHTQINDVLLTALGRAIERWRGRSGAFLIALEGHGRETLGDAGEELDITRTVGWFTTIYPVVLEVKAGSSAGETLKQVKEQLRRVPGRGLGYGVLRYLSATPLKLGAEAQLSFNYLGQIDQVVGEESMYRAGRESVGATQDEHEERAFPLEVTAMVAGEQLQVSWRYSRELHRRETIERVAESYLESLREIVAQCRDEKVVGYTPSDFPLAHFSQQELDSIVAELTPPANSEPHGNKNIIEDIYPVSSLQHGLLFHTQYAPESGINFYQISCSLGKGLDVEAFERAWEQVIQRHAILRTAFVFSQALPPVQVVYRRLPLPLEHQDWRALTTSQQQARLTQLLQDDRRQNFDFTRAPLMRLRLIRLSEESYRFVWSFHHVLLDGWSGPLLVKEVFSYYDAFVRRQHLSLPAPRPYRDYISWLQGQDLSAAERYWRRTLAGFSTPTVLPGAAATAMGSEHEYDEQQRAIDERTSEELRRLGQQHQLTLNTIVQGAWAVLLWRYSGAADVLFGTTVSGRPAELSGVEEMMGLFINTLPVRVRVEGEAAAVDWLRQLQAEAVEMREYEYSPLVEVQRWSEVAAGAPLFESLLVFENFPASELEQREESLEIGNVEVNEGQHYPLCVIVGPGQELYLRIIYERSRFDATTIEQILGHFETWLKNFVANPERRLIEIPLHAENAFSASPSELQFGDEAEEFNFQL